MLILTALYSCKKETPKTEDASTSKDSISVTENKGSENTLYVSKEITPDNMEAFLAKNNDTLYVTNFFATWCGPCIKEIPHFKKKMQELKDQPVKFTFVNLDDRSEWNTSVKKFAEENNLAQSIILLDGKKLDQNFFPKNFKQWDGGSIPFTYIRKGTQTDEYLGMMSEDLLTSKINSFLK